MKPKRPTTTSRDHEQRAPATTGRDASRDRAAGPPPGNPPVQERTYEDRQDAAFDPRGDSAPPPDEAAAPRRKSTQRS